VAASATSALRDAIRVASDAVVYAQELATQDGNTEALETLSLSRRWLAFTLRRLGDPHYTGHDDDLRYGDWPR
jgi:hypothetical protein